MRYLEGKIYAVTFAFKLTWEFYAYLSIRFFTFSLILKKKNNYLIIIYGSTIMQNSTRCNTISPNLKFIYLILFQIPFSLSLSLWFKNLSNILFCAILDYFLFQPFSISTYENVYTNQRRVKDCSWTKRYQCRRKAFFKFLAVTLTQHLVTKCANPNSITPFRFIAFSTISKTQVHFLVTFHPGTLKLPSTVYIFQEIHYLNNLRFNYPWNPDQFC